MTDDGSTLKIDKKISRRSFWRSNSSVFQFIAVILAALSVIIARRPDAVFNPQFWAEDGHYWYGQAYNNGILHTFLLPENGYLQTFSRLVASLAQFLPLRYAPHFFNYLAIAVQLLPVAIIWSPAFRRVVPSKAAALLLIALYLLIPNSSEEAGNITNAHWYLALSAFLLIITETRSKWQAALKYIFLVVAGLSGPFSVILFPVSLIYYFFKRSKSALIQGAILAGTGGCQLLLILLTSSATRSRMPLGASCDRFVTIVGGQVFGAGIFGHQFMNWSLAYPAILSVTFFLGAGLVVLACIKGTLELRLFVLAAVAIFAVSLRAPQISLVEDQWAVLTAENIGIRYYFFPILAWLAVIAWYAANRKFYFKCIGVTLLAAAIVGFIADFRYNSYVDYHFNQDVAVFNQLKQGEAYSFPLNPPGWSMYLVKH